MSEWDGCEFKTLVGQVLSKITVAANKTEIIFETEDGKIYQMYHSQDCCESVELDDVCGDLQKLVGKMVDVAEEVSSKEIPFAKDDDNSYTWTFYKIRAGWEYVTIRWYGSSNGYYSEDVDFVWMNKDEWEGKNK
jgi:hypothetical protein